MKVTVVGMLCVLSVACTDKQKTFLPEAVPASAIAYRRFRAGYDCIDGRGG